MVRLLFRKMAGRFIGVGMILTTAQFVMPARAFGAGGAITIEAGTGRVLTLSGRAANVFAADPKVAEVRPASPTSLFVFGIAVGHTTVAAIDGGGRAVGSYAVDVVPSSAPAREAERLADAMGVRMVDGNVAMRASQNGLILSGNASSPAEASDALEAAQLASASGAKVLDQLHVRGSTQVNLRVRIVEMSRSLTHELGVNWQSVNALGTSAVQGVSFNAPIATLTAAQSAFSFLSRFKAAGRSVTLDTLVDALVQDQLVHVLAEPNLTTMSGEPASFLVGGEFPIPVASYNNTVTVDFKQYGISLSFLPTVLTDGAISLHVRPEVSQLTTQGAVTITQNNSAIQIPALTVRRADTTVQLGSGQSFAIAGLLQDDASLTSQGLPFLGDIPVLGALFRSSSFTHNQTELVIVVTPYVVKPSDNPAALSLPDDGWTLPNDLERILLLRQNGSSRPGMGTTTPMSRPRIPGDAGFIVE